MVQEDGQVSETWDEAVERAMASAPPGVKQAWRTLRDAAGTPTHEVMTDVHRLVDERDALRHKVEELKARAAEERDGADFHAERAAGRLNENDALKRQVEELTAKIARRDAVVAALTARVEALTWEARGAPMKGDAP